METHPLTAPQVEQRAPTLSWLPTISAVIVTALFSSVVVETFFFALRMADLSGYQGINAGNLALTFSAALSIVLQTAILALFVKTIGYRPKEYFGLLLPRKRRDAIIGVAAVIGFVLLKFTLSVRTGGLVIMPDILEEYRAAKNAGALPLLFFAIVVVFPLAEELIFRGFMFRGLENSRIGKTGAIIVTALIWTASHTPYILSYMFFVFILGLLFGWIRGRTGSVLLTCILHMGVNCTVMIEAGSVLQS